MNASLYDPYAGDAAAPIVERRFLDFLRDFVGDADGALPPLDDSLSASFGPTSRSDYVNAVHGMRAHDMSTLYVDYTHLRAHDSALAATVAAEFYRCAPSDATASGGDDGDSRRAAATLPHRWMRCAAASGARRGASSVAPHRCVHVWEPVAVWLRHTLTLERQSPCSLRDLWC